MSVFKRGKVYWIDYYYNDKRVREPVGSREEARIILAERLKDIRQGRNPELRRIRPMLFAEMVTEFLEKHARRSRDYRSFKSNTGILLKHFAGLTLQEITPKAIEGFIAQRLASGLSKATVNRQRACLSKILSCAIEWGYYGGENPVRRVKRFRESPGRTRFLTREEADRLIEHAPRHLRPIILCALHTGGRRREILNLRWDDVDLDRGVLYFDQTNTKSGKQREIPISPALADVLRERRKIRRIAGDAREWVFTRYGKRLGDIHGGFEGARRRAKLGADVIFHTLRHTFASWFVINGGDLYRLQKYLGHSTIALTQRYAHLSREHIQAGVRYIGPPAEKDGHKLVTNA